MNFSNSNKIAEVAVFLSFKIWYGTIVWDTIPNDISKEFPSSLNYGNLYKHPYTKA